MILTAKIPPCNGCCGPSLPFVCSEDPVTMVCRTRGGTASLIGHSEHPDHISSPPRKYLFRDYGGTMHCLTWTMADPPCSALALDCVHALSGACHYSATDGSIVQNDGHRITTGPSNPDYCTPGDYSLACDGWLPGPLCTGYDCGATIVTTATSMIRTGDEGPCQGCGDAWARHTVTGHNSVILSVEDTEDNAKTRLLAGSGGTWGGWEEATDVSCWARWQIRTTGFTFVYQEAQFKVTAENLSAEEIRWVKVDIWRRPYGVGDYAIYQSLYYVGVADDDGKIEIQDDVPNEEGYESFATASCISFQIV